MAGSGLFERIPSGFFNNLASGSNQRLYADCLLAIYKEYDREVSYRIDRHRIRDAVALYLLDNQVSLDAVDESAPSSDYNDMAGAILRRFCSANVGWLEEETDDATYEKQILMSENGLMLAEFLTELLKPQKEEYSGYIIQIYNTLKNREPWEEHPYINGIKSIAQNAKALSKSLKKLSTFIRKTIEKMIREETLESLTENLISYFDGSFIREYSRLIQQQNVHIYRSYIRGEIDQIRSDDALLTRMTADCVKEEELDAAEAEEYIYDLLSSTKQFLTVDYDKIMKDIKHKINVYLQVAIGRARFLQNREVDEKGNVERTMKYIAEEMETLGWKETIPGELQALFAFEKHEYLDLTSLRYPSRTKSIRHTTESELEELTEEQLRDARKEQERERNNPFSRERMKLYFENCLKDRQRIALEELPLVNKEDLLMTLSAAAYGEDNGFVIRPAEGYLETGRMLIRRFEVERKSERGSHGI